MMTALIVERNADGWETIGTTTHILPLYRRPIFDFLAISCTEEEITRSPSFPEKLYAPFRYRTPAFPDVFVYLPVDVEPRTFGPVALWLAHGGCVPS